MTLNKKQIFRSLISFVLIVLMIIPVVIKSSTCCNNTQKTSCSGKEKKSQSIEQDCQLCGFQFNILNNDYFNEIEHYLCKTYIDNEKQILTTQYSRYYFAIKQLRAPPVYS